MDDTNRAPISALPAVELVPMPDRGRTFSAERTVRLGDVDERGALRLDSIARYLQDVATDDALDAGLANAMGWLVRRTLIRVERPATINERVGLVTFCSGRGRSWAERRTTIRSDAGVCVEAVCLWVQIDVDSGRPARLDDGFDRHYADAAGGRTVSSKLSLPRSPPPHAPSATWRFRTTDLDPFGHVNNAAQWAVVEHWLCETGADRVGTGEVEYAQPVDLDELEVRTADSTGWLVVGGTAHTVWRWT